MWHYLSYKTVRLKTYSVGVDKLLSHWHLITSIFFFLLFTVQTVRLDGEATVTDIASKTMFMYDLSSVLHNKEQ